ncbi:hypothetical protein GOBAR_DD18141 [Gossypium barbadense]|nr:hypothetical protein GOBAR_DD18141 [Gossypium barbadense]
MELVVELINSVNREWRSDIITDVFDVVDAARILQVSLAKIKHYDELVWRGEPSSEFTVRSLAAICPRCRDGVETLAYVFHSCPVASEVWGLVGLSVVLSNDNQGWIEWLTWVFNICSTSQFRIFYCTLWALWTARNKRVHEHMIQSCREISNFIHRYICELDGIEENVHTKVVDVTRWEPPSREWVKINFDAAFDRALFYQGQGLLPEMEEEGWLPLDQLYTRMLARLLQRRPSPSFGAAEMGIDLGITEIILEGDSLLTIKKMQINLY